MLAKLQKRMKNKFFILSCFAGLLGILCASWLDIFSNETSYTIASMSLFVSIIALIITNYFTVENAIELRSYNKKSLFCNYCARFSNDKDVIKVAEWLLNITELDSNGCIKEVYPKKKKDDKGKTITMPTRFEKQRFLDFLTEISIMIKSDLLEKDVVRDYFSLYASIFNKVQQTDANICYKQNNTDFSELL